MQVVHRLHLVVHERLEITASVHNLGSIIPSGISLDRVISHTLSATAQFIAQVIQVVERLVAWFHVHLLPVRSVSVLVLVFFHVQHHRAGYRASHITRADRVETLIFHNDVVDDEGRGVRFGELNLIERIFS